MCRLISEISEQLARCHVHWIKFPENLQPTKMQFQRIAQFPKVVGCIDCTHVSIQLPCTINGEQFRNRKGYFSLNVQVIGGPNLEIFDIVSSWPGSTHDSRIFQWSRVYGRFHRRQIRGLLLGDSGYAQNEFTFTPIRNPATPREVRYNRSHIDTRNSVERLFGVWKRRFACLRKKLANAPQTCTHIVTACAVLHNIAISCREAPPPELEQPEVHEDILHDQAENFEGPGVAIRRAFMYENF